VEQIRRRIYFCRCSSSGFTACRQNASIRQQQRRGMVGSNRGQVRHCCPRAGCRIPQLAFICWIGHRLVRTLSTSASAGHQHFAIWKQCSIVEFASSRHHRSSVGPSGIRTVQIDDLCSRRWIGSAIRVKSACTSTHEQHLAVIVHHCRSPVTSPIVAISHRAPSTSAGNIKVPRRLGGPSTEYLAVRRIKHVWKERQRQVRCAQVAPRCRCTPPYLRLDIDTLRRTDPATGHEDVSVWQRSARRVPSTVIHIRQPRPGIVQRVIRVGIWQPHKVIYVSTGYQELSIRQRGKA
jgi:hypothetical protein